MTNKLVSKRREYNINYLRYVVQGLLYNYSSKPVILRATYTSHSVAHLCTFLDPKPYVNMNVYPQGVKITRICDHINILLKDVSEYYDISESDNDKEFILVCRPYLYDDKDGNSRGALALTKELDGYPVVTPYDEGVEEFFDTLDVNKYVDFTEAFDGKYAKLMSKSPTRAEKRIMKKYKLKNDLKNVGSEQVAELLDKYRSEISSSGKISHERSKYEQEVAKRIDAMWLVDNSIDYRKRNNDLIIPECPLYSNSKKVGHQIMKEAHKLMNTKYFGMANSEEASIQEVLGTMYI